MVSIAASSARRLQPLDLDDVDISGAEEPMSPANVEGADTGGVHRVAATSIFVFLIGSALLAAWVGSFRTDNAPALRRGSVVSRSELQELDSEDDSAAQLGKDLFDFYNHANASMGLQARTGANAPAEDMHDGNLCDDDEEMFAKLCYKKCSLLTGGKYSKRTSAWSCCESGESGKCGIFDQKLKLRICGGYDVSGDRAGNGCPHPAGACLDNEEVHLGRCFKKCSLLTDGEYPTRVAAATCCKAIEEWKCLDIMFLKTRKEFNVGGGAEDSDRWPHFPETALTEQQEE